jgi:hypothetical protein
MIEDFPSNEEELMFQVGDDICYINAKKETCPGRVLEIEDKRIKIRYDDFTGTKTQWVSADDIELRETSRCAHNAECGWCDDTGKCIYEK